MVKYQDYTQVPFSVFKSYFIKYTSPCTKKLSTDKRICPYHQEKTASAVLNESADGKHYFYCFGCNKYANVLQFVKDFHSFSWKEAFAELDIYNPIIQGKTKQQQQQQQQQQPLSGAIASLYKKELKDYKIASHDVYTYEAPQESDLLPYYKCVFRSSLNDKEPRFCHFNENGELVKNAPKEQFPYNWTEALQWKQDNESLKENKKKLIILEGEKDVETIKRDFDAHFLGENKYVPISLKGLSKSNMEKYMSFLLQEKDGTKRAVYFLGDNDDAGVTYMNDCYDACKEHVSHFYIVNLSRISEKMIEGFDITDWYNQYVRENAKDKNLKNIHPIRKLAKEIFDDLLFQPSGLHDYHLSEYWASLSVREGRLGVRYVPLCCWENVESFLRASQCKFRKEEVSGSILGSFGLLSGIRDQSNRTNQINYSSLKSLLEKSRVDRGKMIEGMPIKTMVILQEMFNTYVNKRSFIDMLEKIDIKPHRFQLNYAYSFSYENKESIYKAPELLYFLLENIGFTSNTSQKIEFQKILIYKALLMMPYVLRNSFEDKISIRGDLRLIGANGIGKTDFVRALFGDGYAISSVDWYFKMPYLDVLKTTDIKLAFSAPCLFLDEGNIGGKPAEQRAFIDGSSFAYIEKYQIHKTSFVKRSIIISSSNYKEVSYDVNAERRMWAVEVESLPHLVRMSCKKYYNTPEQMMFWDNYLTAQDFFEVGEERYFKFPVLEFWRQINELFKYYYEAIDEQVSLQPHELAFYRKVWIVDKYAFTPLQDKIKKLHLWDKLDNVVRIPNPHFDRIESIYYQEILKSANPPNLTKMYGTMIKTLEREDCDMTPDGTMYIKNKSGISVQVRYRLLPRLDFQLARNIQFELDNIKHDVEYYFNVCHYADDAIPSDFFANEEQLLDRRFSENYLLAKKGY